MTDSTQINDGLKRRSITFLFLAEIAVMGLWFVSSAVAKDMASDVSISDVQLAWLVSGVTIGFVLGALLSAVTGLADRVDPRKLFFIAALLAAFSNAAVLLFSPDNLAVFGLRVMTGFCLAAVYPVGMKIAIGWGTTDRGFLVGLIVGGLTLGSAAPHLLAFFGGTDWRMTTIVASLFAFFGGVLVLFTHLGPAHRSAPKFEADAFRLAWSDKRIRLAFAGYFGHMWELYAMWAWLSVALFSSYQMQMPDEKALEMAKLSTFIAIAAGGLLCPIAGLFADRIGKELVTIIAMVVSCFAALLTAFTFGGAPWLVFGVAVLWGLSIIPDSAQFSALVADYAPPEKAGSLMTLQTAIGFALTIIAVQLTPWLAAIIGWPGVFVVLAIGPALGVLSMLKLRKLLFLRDRKT